MIRCPYCKKLLDEVYVISEYTQRGLLEGKKIDSYEELGHTGGIGKTVRIECSECGRNIKKFVKE